MSVVGARPQFVKLAPIDEAIQSAGHTHTIVHTGQHYDDMLSGVFFRDLGISEPDVHLGVGSGSHGVQTGSMLGALDAVFDKHLPDCVLVYGDTNSTLAAALSAVKLHYPVAHLEAGLRSFNRKMPEEHNRVLTDHAADLCLAPSELAMRNLEAEGLGARSLVVGDVMTDVLLRVRDRVTSKGGRSDTADEFGLEGYYVATIHRAENTDDPSRLKSIVDALAAADKPVVLFAHPRLCARAQHYGLDLGVGAIVLRDSIAYPDLVAAVLTSAGVATDSGGLQKEAFLLRVPCTTLRNETEWVETVDLGWNVLANSAPEIRAALSRRRPLDTSATPYGDGKAAERAVSALSRAFATSNAVSG